VQTNYNAKEKNNLCILLNVVNYRLLTISFIHFLLLFLLYQLQSLFLLLLYFLKKKKKKSGHLYSYGDFLKRLQCTYVTENWITCYCCNPNTEL